MDVQSGPGRRVVRAALRPAGAPPGSLPTRRGGWGAGWWRRQARGGPRPCRSSLCGPMAALGWRRTPPPAPERPAPLHTQMSTATAPVAAPGVRSLLIWRFSDRMASFLVLPSATPLGLRMGRRRPVQTHAVGVSVLPGRLFARGGVLARSSPCCSQKDHAGVTLGRVPLSNVVGEPSSLRASCRTTADA